VPRSLRIGFPDVGCQIISRVGISASAVNNIRRRVREALTDVLPVVDRLLATIREAESATTQSVK